MRSISNKIALTLIVLLSVCFAAMSAVLATLTQKRRW